MLRSFYAGISGLRNHQQAMDVIGNNISNVNTPGFKSSRVTFMDTLSQTLQGVREASTVLGGRNPVQIGSGMTVAAIDRNMGQGSAQSTGRNMDLAIEGKGFFIVGNSSNYYYSRSGATSMDNSFNLVTDTGDQIYGWIDSDQNGQIDTARDNQGWINLDRRGDGRITNVVASATPMVSGPNQGDATLGQMITIPTTVTDNWRVEAIRNPSVVALEVSNPAAATYDPTSALYDARFDSTRTPATLYSAATLAAAQDAINVSVVGSTGYDAASPSYNAAFDSSNAAYDVAALTAAQNALTVSVAGGTGYDPKSTSYDGRFDATNLVAYDAAALAAAQASALTEPPLLFQVTGAKSGVLGTVRVGETFENAGLGSFVVNGGASQRATLGVQGITVTANDFGAGGNDYSVEFVNKGVNQSLGVTVQGTKIIVNLGTNGLGQVTSTTAQVAAKINELAGSVVTASGGDATTAASLTQRYLQNGSGPDEGDYFTFSTTAAGGATVEGISVAKDGTIIGVFDNGTTEELARIALGNVTNPEGLLSVGSGKFAESPTSGSGFPPVTAGTGGTGTIAAGFLEMSNVDLTREFTDMITTQRGFQANSKIITTSDEMLQDLLTLKR